jgi:hypothetical protein
MKYDLRPEDYLLVEAAIKLGDWLASYEETTPEQIDAIRYLQNALRRLPESSPDVNAQYGFRAIKGRGFFVEMPDDAWQGVSRAWAVTMYPPGVIEIFSNYSPYPEVHIFKKLAHELGFELRAGEPNPHIGAFYFNEWIDEVSDPAAFIDDEVVFKVEALIWPPAN